MRGKKAKALRRRAVQIDPKGTTFKWVGRTMVLVGTKAVYKMLKKQSHN
jgi:hypothetical protein